MSAHNYNSNRLDCSTDKINSKLTDINNKSINI